MGIFGGLGKAPPPGGGGNFFTDGKYLVNVNKTVAGISQKGEGPFAAVECTILEVIAGYPNSNKPGEDVSAVFMFQKHQPAMSNFKGYMAAATGIHEMAKFAEHPTAINPSTGRLWLKEITPEDEWPAGWSDVTDREWEAAAEAACKGDGMSLAGTELVVNAVSVGTRKGGQFTRLTWRDPEDADPDQV